MMGRFFSSTAFSQAKSGQAGQALLEAVLGMSLLAVFWVGLQWLANYQDAALPAIHASRHAAFVATRAEQSSRDQVLLQPFFTGDAHRWTDRRGDAVMAAKTGVELSIQRRLALSAQAQAGSARSDMTALRRDWSVEDKGILQARVAMLPRAGVAPQTENSRSMLNLALFDLPYPALSRSTFILTGAGHSVSDSEVQSRLAGSPAAWSRAYAVSRATGSGVWLRAEGVDQGWNRPAVDFDWLHPWGGRVPGYLLTAYASTYEGGH